MDQKKAFIRIGWTLFIVCFVNLFVLSMIIPPVFELLLGAGTLSKVLSTFVCDALVLLLCWWRLKPLPLGEVPQKGRISVKQFIVVFSIGLVCVYVVGTMTNALLSGIYGLFGVNYGSVIEQMISKDSTLETVILVAIFAPIFEELVFRKFFFERLLPYGTGFAIFITALSFGLFHGNIEQVPYTFVMGLFLGYLMAKTGDIRVPILAHFINNLWSTLGLMVKSSGTSVSVALSGYVDLIFPVMGLIFLAMILVKNKGTISLPKEMINLHQSDVKAIVKTRGFVVFTAMEIIIGISIIVASIMKGGILMS